MPYYCLNENENDTGKHQVHRLDQHLQEDGSFDYCRWLPDEENQIELGFHFSCKTAVDQAKYEHFQNSDGCFYCCHECHEG